MNSFLSRRLARTVSTLAVLLVSAAASANSSQFIARQYTEALGRAPDANGWKSNQAYFAANGCNKATLKSVAVAVFGSQEYANLGYDSAEKVLTAYRALYSREPDATGFNYWVAYLNGGNSVSSMIDFMFQAIDGGELTSTQICKSLGYGWKSDLPLTNSTIAAKDDGGIKTLAQLQTSLQNAKPGTTVYLSQRALIPVSNAIVVPAGVTLATMGRPPRTQYAKQARLVRAVALEGDDLTTSVVRLESGAKLDSVWVSGQKQRFGDSVPAVNVAMHSGTGTTLVNSRLDDSRGWTAVVAHHYGLSCSGMLVSNNLVAGYANAHDYAGRQHYTDGISGNCEDFTVTSNDVVDASDVAIIVFAPGLGRNQKSQVSLNVVVSAGVPAFGALMMHPQRIADVGAATTFNGAVISYNQFWAAPDTHFDIGLVLGGATWDIDPSVGSGASAFGNTNNGIVTPMYIGLLVDGMNGAAISNNAITRASPRETFADIPMVYRFGCNTRTDAVADLTPGLNHASASGLGQTTVNAQVHACIGHGAP